MPQASALVRQSHTALSAAAFAASASASASASVSAASSTAHTTGWRGLSVKKLLQQQPSELGALASSLPSSAAAASFFSHQASSAQESARRTIPPAFFQSTSPFLRSGQNTKALGVPELEPFSLQSQVELRDTLLKELQGSEQMGKMKRVWDAYVALSCAPTTDADSATSLTVVNLLPFIEPRVHQEVLRCMVQRNKAEKALASVKRRMRVAEQEDVPAVSFRMHSLRPARKQHLHPVLVSRLELLASKRAPFILEQMRLASQTQLPADAPVSERTPWTADYNLVLSSFADTGNVVPLSKVWCTLTEDAAKGIGHGPDLKSYAIVMRGLYVHLQHQLEVTRKEHAGKTKETVEKAAQRKKYVGKQPLERALFEAAPAESMPSDGDAASSSARSKASYFQRKREQSILGNAYQSAKSTNLAIMRLKTVLEHLDASPLLQARVEWEHVERTRYWRKQVIDYALRVMRLGGDLQGMALLIQKEFGYRLGHPDVLEPEKEGGGDYTPMTIHTLNTIIMALGEHANATDMVVAYESLARPLGVNAPGASASPETKSNWRSAADDEEDEGLLGLTSGEAGRVSEEDAAQRGSSLFKLEWSALSFQQQQQQQPEEGAASPTLGHGFFISNPSVGGLYDMPEYAIQPSTTTLRTLVRHLCTKSLHVVHRYATLSRTPLPRGDWTARSLQAKPTPAQAQRIAENLLLEDKRRNGGDYFLLALAYLREGIDVYRNSLGRMDAALQPQPADAAKSSRSQVLSPPHLMPTATCFRPAISAAVRLRNARGLRALRALVLESMEQMQRERDILARASAHWSHELEQTQTREDELQGRPAPEREAEMNEVREQVRERERVLRELVFVVERQSKLVREEMRYLEALVVGSQALVGAEEATTTTTTREASEGEEASAAADGKQDGAGVGAGTSLLQIGGIDLLLRRITERRRSRRDQLEARFYSRLQSAADAEEARATLEQQVEQRRLARRARKQAAAAVTGGAGTGAERGTAPFAAEPAVAVASGGPGSGSGSGSAA
ncbi:hypothetical protein OC834_006600 [Tilletia horrida]|nr:hypothetical protein OC834_006600 [Tilletia horrida]